jgi:hypothetical protein
MTYHHGMTAHTRPEPILLIGLKEIGRALGCGDAELRRFIRMESFPVFRVGRSYVTTHGKLAEWAETKLPAARPSDLMPETPEHADTMLKAP